MKITHGPDWVTFVASSGEQITVTHPSFLRKQPDIEVQHREQTFAEQLESHTLHQMRCDWAAPEKVMPGPAFAKLRRGEDDA